MSALPTSVYLRRHALPAHYLADLGYGARAVPPQARAQVAEARRPVAVWLLGERGRLVCRWRLKSGPDQAG